MNNNRKKIVQLIQSKIHANKDLNGDQLVYFNKIIDEMFKVFEDHNGKPIVIKREIRKILTEL